MARGVLIRPYINAEHTTHTHIHIPAAIESARLNNIGVLSAIETTPLEFTGSRNTTSGVAFNQIVCNEDVVRHSIAALYLGRSAISKYVLNFLCVRIIYSMKTFIINCLTPATRTRATRTGSGNTHRPYVVQRIRFNSHSHQSNEVYTLCLW